MRLYEDEKLVDSLIEEKDILPNVQKEYMHAPALIINIVII